MTDETRWVPGYVLHERIGQGADSEVFRAEAVGQRGRMVAVKRIRGRAEPGVLERLRREAEILAGLAHPGILRLLEVVPDGPGIALALAYAPGGSLAELASGQPRPPAEVAAIGARLAGALGAIHGAGLVHGDVTPANVLFDAEGQPLLADFGTARVHAQRGVGTTQDDPNERRATEGFVAPEVVNGAQPDERSDLYGLGMTLRYALGQAHAGDDQAGEDHTCETDDGDHRRLRTAITAACQPDPGQRPASAQELAAALDQARLALEGEHGITVPPAWRAANDEPPPAPATRRFGPSPAAVEERESTPLDARIAVAAMIGAVATPVTLAAWLVTSAWGG